MNNSVFGKTMGNVRNYRDIKLVTTDKRRKRLVSEPNYHTHKNVPEYLMAIEMKKTKAKMTKSICLGLSILDIIIILNFGTITVNQSMGTEQNCVIWILIALLFMLKLKIFIKTIQMMLKYGLICMTAEE